MARKFRVYKRFYTISALYPLDGLAGRASGCKFLRYRKVACSIHARGNFFWHMNLLQIIETSNQWKGEIWWHVGTITPLPIFNTFYKKYQKLSVTIIDPQSNKRMCPSVSRPPSAKPQKKNLNLSTDPIDIHDPHLLYAVGQKANMSFYDEIEIEDMTYHESTTLYTYPCPCGDQFEIALADLRDGEDVAVCPSCSLQIKSSLRQ